MRALPIQYTERLSELKTTIHQSTLKSFFAANAELILLYWKIGKTILEQQALSGRELKIFEHLADDLKKEFPDMRGFSVRNLRYMSQFAFAYPDRDFVRSTLTKITWYHHVTLLSKISDPELRLLYVKLTYEQGWSRDIMVAHIDSGYIEKMAIEQHK